MDFFNKFFDGKQNKSLLHKIVLTFFVLSEITAIYIVYSANLNYVDSLKKSVFNQVNTIKFANKFQLQNWLLESQYESFAITSALDVRQKIASVVKTKSDNVESAKAIAELKFKLTNFAEKNPKIDSIFVLDNSDKVLLSVDGLNTAKFSGIDSEESYKSIIKLENTSTSKKITPKDSSNLSFSLAIKNSKPIINFVNPIFDEYGIISTNVLVSMKFEQVIGLIFDQSNLDVSVNSYLISKFQGRNLIISKNFQGVKADNELINDLGADLVLKKSETNPDKNNTPYKNYMGEFVFGSYNLIEDLNIALVSEIKQETVFEPANRVLRDMALIATGLVLFMTTICYLMVRQRVQSVFVMTDVALAIAEGNLESKFPVKQQDEIGALAIAFNNMLSRFKYLNQQFVESQYVFSQQVNQSDEILQNLMDSTNEGVVFLDRNNFVSQINLNLAEILSISIPEATRARYNNVFPEEICNLIDSTRWKHQEIAVTEFSIPYQDVYKARVSNIFCEGTTGKMQFLGMIVVVWQSVSPILSGYSSDDSYNSAINNSHDMTDIRNEISASLRTPMTSLLGFLKLTKGKLDGAIFPKLNIKDDESQRTVRQISNNFEVMITEGTQIALVIENIMDVQTSSHSQINDSEIKIEKVLMADILNQVNLGTLPLFEQKDSRLIFDIVECSRSVVECNREDIIYVFTNLLTRISNFLNPSRIAVCHARLINGRIAVTIGEVNALLSHKQILSIVSDVYNLINDIENPTQPSREIGLAKVQEILQKYNGTVSLEQVDSLRNRSKFYIVTLPNKLV
jgi:signal transduction histidine kinase